MSAQLEVYSDIDSQLEPPTFAHVYQDYIDEPNALREARQRSQITTNELSLDNISYSVTDYMPTQLRAWRDSGSNKVTYPHIVLAHGVASNAVYFDSLFQKLNKLGLGCSAISLPRHHQYVDDGDALLSWQSSALVQTHDYLQKKLDNPNIVLGGHSRGAIVAIKAIEQIVQRDPAYDSAGLLLLAPAGLERLTPLRMAKAALNLGPLALNSLQHAESMRQLGRYATMITRMVLENPQQTLIECYQALNTHVGEDLYKYSANMSVLITAAEFDEFVDYQHALQFAKSAPNTNISLASLDTNHMLGERNNGEIISLADPRLLTGQILAWLQSQTPNYSPLIAHSNGTISRLSD